MTGRCNSDMKHERQKSGRSFDVQPARRSLSATTSYMQLSFMRPNSGCKACYQLNFKPRAHLPFEVRTPVSGPNETFISTPHLNTSYLILFNIPSISNTLTLHHNVSMHHHWQPRYVRPRNPYWLLHAMVRRYSRRLDCAQRSAWSPLLESAFHRCYLPRSAHPNCRKDLASRGNIHHPSPNLRRLFPFCPAVYLASDSSLAFSTLPSLMTSMISTGGIVRA
jgi:hypothetical protein